MMTFDVCCLLWLFAILVQVSNGILFSAVLVPEGRIPGNPQPPTAEELLSKLEEFAAYHRFRTPKLIYYADQDTSVTAHENIVAKMRMRSHNKPHARLPVLPEAVGRVSYPFVAGTFAKLLTGMQSRAIGFSSMWKGAGNNVAGLFVVVAAAATAVTAAAAGCV